MDQFCFNKTFNWFIIAVDRKVLKLFPHQYSKRDEKTIDNNDDNDQSSHAKKSKTKLNSCLQYPDKERGRSR